MLRLTLLAAVATLAFGSTAAEAAVLPTLGNDTLTITGDAADDQIVVRALSPSTLQVGADNFDRSAVSKIAIRAGAGNDTVQIQSPLTEAMTIETGAGADTVLGGPGAETISTGGGDDQVKLGNGDDTAVQDDGSDLIEGEAGNDRLLVAGSADSEEFTLQA